MDLDPLTLGRHQTEYNFGLPGSKNGSVIWIQDGITGLRLVYLWKDMKGPSASTGSGETTMG